MPKRFMIMQIAISKGKLSLIEKCNTTLKAFNGLDIILVSNVIWIKRVYWDLQASKTISKQNVLISKQDLEVLRMFPFRCNSHWTSWACYITKIHQKYFIQWFGNVNLMKFIFHRFLVFCTWMSCSLNTYK
jgi:hypothetical protein